ncbi:phage virion morphogenesis protein [Gallibacterium anatis]|uniref:phage virion morphogenesis protein n=1 Tax=Gallibacterium anatis TaxID=750 RepID=UPI0039FD019D
MTARVSGFTSSSYRKIKRTLKALNLPAQKQKEVLKLTLWRIKGEAKKNITAQRTPDGKQWQSRKSDSKKKMLRRRGRLLTITSNNGKEAVLGYRNKKEGELAALHHYGQQKTEVTKAELEAIKATHTGNSDPCTEQQAIRLRSLGYQIKNKKGKLVKPTKKAIQATVSKGRAGVLIRILKREKSGNKAKNGTPARPALNMDVQHNANILAEFVEKALNANN